MFFRSFSGAVGRVCIGTTIGALACVGTVQVYEWFPAIVTAAQNLVG